MEKIKLFSLVVPVYKQEKTIKENITSIEDAILPLNIPYELIIVVDGFLDHTYEVAKKMQHKKVKVLGYEQNRGKGSAIKYGVSHADGDIIGFIDAGMDLDATAISILLNTMVWNDADIVIGSKLHPDSKVNYPTSRKVLSWGYRSIIKILFGLSVRDTQVGLKIFKKNVAKKVFPRIVVKKFAFDIEVLALANAMGFSKIYEAPIELHFKQTSIRSSNLWKVIFWMLWDTCAVFYRLKILHYYKMQNV